MDFIDKLKKRKAIKDFIEFCPHLECRECAGSYRVDGKSKCGWAKNFGLSQEEIENAIK